MLRIRPYILAGGKSSRMGRDKAMLELEGKTLLARAVETLRSVKKLQSPDGLVEVTVCGEREALEGADRAIVDRYPSCGPLGGIEAALHDLTAQEDVDWAFFIPVDMPLLSSALIDQLLASWASIVQMNGQLLACFVEAESRPQPLVSLVSRSLLVPVQKALDAGRYKVVPVLQSAGAACTSFDQEVSVKDLNLDESEQASRIESPFSEGRGPFTNVNTEADLINVATLLRRVGSNWQPESPAR